MTYYRAPTDCLTGLAERRRQEADATMQRPLLTPAEEGVLVLAWQRWLAIRGLMENVTRARRRQRVAA